MELGRYFDTKAMATNRTSQHWGTTSRPKNGIKTYILALGYHFETKTTATSGSSQHWGTTSRPQQQQQIVSITSRPKPRQQMVHLCIGAPLRDQSNRLKSYIFALGDESNGNKSYLLAFGHHFEANATATNHTFSNWGTTSKPKQWQQIVHLSIGPPLQSQSNGNIS